MRRILLCSFYCFVFTTVAEPLLAQSGPNDECSGKGTFARSTREGRIEYCWHGTYYTESNAPENVIAFFAEAVAKHKASARRDNSSRRAASRARTSPKAYASRAVPRGSAAAATRPIDQPVGADLIESIKPGTDRDTVLAKLGRPHGSITNLGDEGTEEIWSYRILGGGIAKVRLDRGSVVAVKLPPSA